MTPHRLTADKRLNYDSPKCSATSFIRSPLYWSKTMKRGCFIPRGNRWLHQRK